MTAEERIETALDLAYRYGQIEGDHHRAWTIDQMVRALHGGSGQAYENFIADHNNGDDGPETYSWDIGIAP